MTTLVEPAHAARTWGRRTGYWWVALTAVGMAAFAVTPYLTSSLHVLAHNDVGLARNYVDRPAPIRAALYVHLSCAGLALLLSPLQFAAALRRRARRLHRAVGRVVFIAILIGGPAGMVISTVSLAGWVGTAGFGLLGVLWVSFAVTAFRAIRRGDVAAHRRWAVRTFALTYAGVTLRLLMPTLVVLQVSLQGVSEQAAFDRAYAFIPFLCWVPNLLVAEGILFRERTTGTPLHDRVGRPG